MSIKDKNEQDIISACKSGGIETIKEFLLPRENEYEVNIPKYNMALYAISSGNIELVKLIFDYSLKFNRFFSANHIHSFATAACDTNNAGMMDFVLTYPSIFKNKPLDLLPRTLNHATNKGYLNSIKYILDNFLDTEHEIKGALINGNLVNWAARNGHLEIIEYFFNTEQTRKFVNREKIKEDAFKIAIQETNVNLLKYIICELKIEETPFVQDLASSNKYVEDIFKLRELNKVLNENLLNTEQNNSKRMKI